LLPLYGTIVFAATVAQEEGNGAGIRHLLEETLPKLGVTPDLAILGEPTALHVSNGDDGSADVDIRVVSGDGDAAVRTIRSIRDALTTAAALAVRAGKKSSVDSSEPTVAASHGSTEAVLRVRCRVALGEAVANCVGSVKRIVLSAVEAFGDASVEVHVHTERRRFYSGRAVEILCWNNPWVSEPAHPLLRRALDALAAAGWPDPTPRPRGLKNLPGGTAGSLSADACHIPTLCFGPGDVRRVYAPDEFVTVEDLIDAVFGTAVLVYGAIGAPISLVWPTRRRPRDAGHISMTGGGR
jgi:acetylornithine deacetylase/succinyl-diaminopimelate desuccinylase-like protein